MQKGLLIIVGIVALLGAIAIVLQKNNPNESVPQVEEQVDGDSYVATSTFPIIPTDPTLTVGSKSLETFTVVNFLNAENVYADSQNSGHFYLGNTFETTPGGDTPTYVITYDQSSQIFTIALLQTPFKQSRIDAEFYLRDVLNLSNEQMCALRYLVTVPLYVDNELSGKDLKFSFCPDSTPL